MPARPRAGAVIHGFLLNDTGEPRERLDLVKFASAAAKTPPQARGTRRQRSGGQSAGEPFARAKAFACSAPVES